VKKFGSGEWVNRYIRFGDLIISLEDSLFSSNVAVFHCDVYKHVEENVRQQ
jgi:hypothetical protein